MSNKVFNIGDIVEYDSASVHNKNNPQDRLQGCKYVVVANKYVSIFADALHHDKPTVRVVKLDNNNKQIGCPSIEWYAERFKLVSEPKSEFYIATAERALQGDYDYYDRIAPYTKYSTEIDAVKGVHDKFNEVGDTTLKLAIVEIKKVFIKEPTYTVKVLK